MDASLETMIAAARTAVNALVVASPGVVAVIHWFDMDEHREPVRFGGGGIKNKFPIEVECFAIGLLTGEPIADIAAEPHPRWVLPVETLYKTTLRPAGLAWELSDAYPQNMGGTYPSLTEAENTGYVPLGDTQWREARAAR